jgi:hypothetical protein
MHLTGLWVVCSEVRRSSAKGEDHAIVVNWAGLFCVRRQGRGGGRERGGVVCVSTYITELIEMQVLNQLKQSQHPSSNIKEEAGNQRRH